MQMSRLENNNGRVGRRVIAECACNVIKLFIIY